MTQLTSGCATCANYLGELCCLAFPDGIPADILDGDFDHTQPHEGDNGVRYEPRP